MPTHKDCQPVDYVMNGHQYQFTDGAVVIAAITSCTNTSNPKSAPMAAGLLAKKAVNLGSKRQPWVKRRGTRLESCSYFTAKANDTVFLDQLGVNLVGYGCTTCIGNSGRCPILIPAAIKKGDLTVGGPSAVW